MWMSREDAARALVVTVRTLRRYVAAGEIRAEGDRGSRRYWVDGGTRNPGEQSGTRDPVDDAASDNLRDDGTAEGWTQREGYVYDGDGDLYIVNLTGHRLPFVRSGEWVRSLWRAYTSGATIADVCRHYEIDKKTFEALKRALALTKTRAPWTD